MHLGYSKYELKDIILSSGRCIFYDDSKFLKLKNFFLSSLGMTTREFCSLTSKHQRIISLSLNDSLGISLSFQLYLYHYFLLLAVKVDHLRNDTIWNISNERLCEIIKFAPGILTTPASTTEQLWSYLDEDLRMDNNLIRAFIDDYPGFLRVNKETLALKVEYVVISEILLMACRSDVLESDMNEQFENEMRDVKLNLLRNLFTSMAAKILAKSGMAFTCSLERLQSRLLFVSNSKICPNLVSNDEDDNGEVIEHPNAKLVINILSLKKDKPMWLSNNLNCNIDDPHINGIMLLTSILSYESVLELVKEWEQIDRTGQLSSLPAPPSYCFLYTESKFNKWLYTIPRSYRKKLT